MYYMLYLASSLPTVDEYLAEERRKLLALRRQSGSASVQTDPLTLTSQGVGPGSRGHGGVNTGTGVDEEDGLMDQGAG